MNQGISKNNTSLSLEVSFNFDLVISFNNLYRRDAFFKKIASSSYFYIVRKK